MTCYVEGLLVCVNTDAHLQRRLFQIGILFKTGGKNFRIVFYGSNLTLFFFFGGGGVSGWVYMPHYNTFF
jgi:hypothetical protein